MKRILAIGFCSFLTALFSCGSKGRDTAQFRVGQFLLSSDTAKVSFFVGSSEAASIQLGYGELSDYQKIEKNVYDIKVWADGALILEKKLGMGKDGIYTLVLTGIPEKNQSVNKSSTLQKLHLIAEGSEGISSNDFLPQLLVHNDFFVAEESRAKIALTNLLPGAAPIGTLLTGNDKKIKFGAVAYPQTSPQQTVGTGDREIRLRLDGNRLAQSLGGLTLEPGASYSLYLVPDTQSYLTHPKLVVGKTLK